MNEIDVLITSASRPECLKLAMESFLKYVKYTGKFRLILHEDVVLKKESGEVLHWAKYSKIFDKIIKTEPAKRLSQAVFTVLQEAQTKYILKLEDDWVFTRDVDIDYAIETMEKNPEITQLYFSKANQSRKVIFKNGMKVIAPVGKGPNEFAMAIGIWRLDFIKPRWCKGINAYFPIMEVPVHDYLYGKDDGIQNTEHIGKVSTSRVKVE